MLFFVGMGIIFSCGASFSLVLEFLSALFDGDDDLLLRALGVARSSCFNFDPLLLDGVLFLFPLDLLVVAKDDIVDVCSATRRRMARTRGVVVLAMVRTTTIGICVLCSSSGGRLSKRV